MMNKSGGSRHQHQQHADQMEGGPNQPGHRKRGWPFVNQLYLVLVVLECCYCVGMSVFFLAFSSSKALQAPAVLAAYSSLAFLMFAVEALVDANHFQFVASLMASFLMPLVALYEMTDGDKARAGEDDLDRKLLKISSYVTLIFEVVYLIMAKFIYQAFSYQIYKSVGANAMMQEVLRTYCIFSTLLKVDFYVLVLVALFSLVYENETMERWMSVGIMVYALCWAVFSGLSVRREKFGGTIVFLVLALVQPAFVIYKIVDFFESANEPASRDHILLAMGIVYLIIRFALMYWMQKASRNYNKGLMNVVYNRGFAGHLYQALMPNEVDQF